MERYEKEKIIKITRSISRSIINNKLLYKIVEKCSNDKGEELKIYFDKYAKENYRRLDQKFLEIDCQIKELTLKLEELSFIADSVFCKKS